MTSLAPLIVETDIQPLSDFGNGLPDIPDPPKYFAQNKDFSAHNTDLYYFDDTENNSIYSYLLFIIFK